MGQSKLNGFDKLESAVKDFEKKFKDKTKNNWSDRTTFVSHPGKYTLIEVDGEQDSEIKVDVIVHLTGSGTTEQESSRPYVIDFHKRLHQELNVSNTLNL